MKYLVLAVVFVTHSLMALPFGDLLEPQEDFFGVGFYGDYVFDRSLEIDREHFHEGVGTSELYTNAALLSLSFFNRYELFGTIGVSSFYLDANTLPLFIAAFTPKGQRLLLSTDSAFSWSVGSRAILYERKRLSIGAEGQFFRTVQSVDSAMFQLSYGVNPGGIDLTYYEWQVGFGALYQVHPSVHPYIAVTWAFAHLGFGNKEISFSNNGTPPSNDGTIKLHNMQSDKHWGYAVGFAFPFSSKTRLNVEARLADARELYVNGSVFF